MPSVSVIDFVITVLSQLSARDHNTECFTAYAAASDRVLRLSLLRIELT